MIHAISARRPGAPATILLTLLTALALLCSQIARAEDGKLADKSAVRNASEQFMARLAEGKAVNAYDEITAYVGVDLEQFAEVKKRETQYIAEVITQLGKPLSYATIEYAEIGDHFYKTIHLLKFDSAALIWELTYYQPSDGWQLIGVNHSTNIDALFETRAASP